MEATYEITPDMLGLTQRRVLRKLLVESVAAALLWVVLVRLFHGSSLTWEAAVALIPLVMWALLVRPMSRTKLRVSDNCIEELDGPAIHSNEIARVKEFTGGGHPGIEIYGKRKVRWLPEYRIFIPAALPQYQEIRKTVHSWTGSRDWQTV